MVTLFADKMSLVYELPYTISNLRKKAGEIEVKFKTKGDL